VESGSARREIMEIRHSSLFVPRDFDISPYFAVVKPTIQQGFDYRAALWVDMESEQDSGTFEEVTKLGATANM
jgi:hypothetical protein